MGSANSTEYNNSNNSRNSRNISNSNSNRNTSTKPTLFEQNNKFENLIEIIKNYETLDKYDNNLESENNKIISEIDDKIQSAKLKISNNNDYYNTNKTLYQEKKLTNQNLLNIITILTYSNIFLFVMIIILFSIKLIGGRI
jgi:hypothetical protein